MAKFRALPVTKDGDRQSIAATELTDADLVEGNVSIAVEHSTVNYKDRLPIIRKFPLIPGIDLVGRVLARKTRASKWAIGRAERLWSGRGAPRRLRRAGLGPG